MAQTMSTSSGLASFVGRTTRRLLGSFDPLRRWRIRCTAHKLVSDKAWAGDEATAQEIARLALLRVLWLQKQVRRAARNQEDEAAAMLARAAIEGTLSGLYCVYVPGATQAFAGETARRAKKLIAGLADGLGGDFLAGAFDSLGRGKLPTVTEMVRQITEHGGGAGVGKLHGNFYDQVSTLYIHGGPLGLLRHVHPRTNRTRERPYSAWSRRSAVQTADAMVGLLAAASSVTFFIAGEVKPAQGLAPQFRADRTIRYSLQDNSRGLTALLARP